MKILDNQGNEIRSGIAYKFIFGHPGPDVTTVVVDEVREDGTVSAYDVLFKMRIESIKADQLWRPIKHKWDSYPQDRDAVIAYAGSSALSLE